MNATQQTVLDTIRTHGVISNGDIFAQLGYGRVDYNTIRRITQELRAMNLIEETGERNIMREKTFRIVTPVEQSHPIPESAAV